MNKVEVSILDAIGSQPRNTYNNIAGVSITAKKVEVRPQDAEPFRAEMLRLIDDTDRHWESYRFSKLTHPRNYKAEINNLPTLSKYLERVDCFDGAKRAEGRNWIIVQNPKP